MPNLIELIVSVVGADKAAVDMDKLNQSLGRTTGFEWKQWWSGEQAINQVGTTAAATAPKIRTFHESLLDLSAGVRDSLAPHLDSTIKQMLALAAAATAARTVYSGIKGAIGDGAEYQRLSLRLGESVHDIIIQEQAFKNAGLSAGYLATASNLLDRALSPLNQNAKRNAEVFSELGISMSELRMQSFGQQLETLSAAFAKLPDQAARTEAAMQIFGRYAGGQMLQILSDPKALELAKTQAGEYADEMSRVASEMNDTQRDLSVVNLRFKELWLGVSEELLPALREISGLVGGMNFTGFGQVLGFSGPLAAGGLMALWGVDKLDMKLIAISERFANSMTGAFASVAAVGSGFIAEMLPPVLAAALVGSIVSGVIQALADDSLRDALNRAAAVGRQRASDTRLVTSVTSTSEADANLKKLEGEIATNEKRLDDLLRKKNDATKSNTSTMTSIGLAGAPSSVQFAARSSSWGDSDEQSLLDLQNVIIHQRLEASKLKNQADVARTIAANQANTLKASLTPLIANIPQLQKVLDRLTQRNLSPAARIQVDTAEIAKARHELDTMPSALKGTREGDVFRIQHETTIQKAILDHAQAQKLLNEQLHRSAQLHKQIEVYELQTAKLAQEALGNKSAAARISNQIAQRQILDETGNIPLADRQKRSEAIGNLFNAQIQREDARDRVEKEQITLENTLTRLRDNLARIQADYRQTDAEKWEARKREMLAELAAITAEKKAMDLAARSATDGDAKKAYQQRASGLGQQAGAVQHQIYGLGPNPTDVFQQMVAQMTKLRGEWTITAASIAHGAATVTGSIGSGLSNGLFDAFEGRARSLSRVLGTVWTSIGQSGARMLSDLVAKWIMEHTIMAAWSKLFRAGEVAGQAASTGAQVAIHATGEAAKTGATAAGAGARSGISLGETLFHGLQVALRVAMHIAGEVAKTAITIVQAGIRIATVIAESLAHVVLAAVGAMSAVASIPYVGPFLAVAAMAGILAAGYGLVRGISKGFKVGGSTGSGPDDGVAGDVHYNEYVFSAPAVRKLGVSRLDAMHQAALAGSSGGVAAAMSGASGGVRTVSPTVNAHFYMDRARFARAMIDDEGGQFFDLMDMWQRKRA